MYAKFLTKEYFDFDKLEVRHAASLLKSIATLQKVSSES